MKKIIEYDVVEYSNYEDFIRTVNTHIQIGWQPLGGVGTCIDDDLEIYYSQAMVKYED